ncbi:cell filamentation protein Fic [Apibacter muscae]|uniref:virulence RhuM family protein n=1 Tax=Apibacter muscae TaxID=2509004 RepID=UPI0011AC722A|nr:virulence RhuM family protein [Apibacter muscae]TWP24245.1 cell filamentation protein Fic [Apibacter muscae]
MSDNIPILPSDELSEFILYTDPSGKVKVEIFVMNDTVWLTQQRIAELFDTSKQNISYHLSNIFKDNELDENSVVKEFLTTAADGKNYKTKFYNLDAIISVGYRVNSTKATQFRIWATNTLKEFIIKGFVLDDDRLKDGKKLFSKDYFKELLERIRSIRANERRIYQQITDIFQECSIDYDKNSEITKNFYAMVQNKFHYAITGHTAAEIIYLNADSTKPNMGLKTWKNSPDGRIIKSDTNVAKNYLNEDEIKQLERTVSSYFDYIEGLVERRTTFTMEALAESVNKFLEFNEYRILDGKGTRSQKQAENKAFAEYDVFNKTQKIESDFDKMVKSIQTKKKN